MTPRRRYRAVTAAAKPPVSGGECGMLGDNKAARHVLVTRVDPGLTAVRSGSMKLSNQSTPAGTDWDEFAAPFRPDARGGTQCLRHVLAGWPGGRDCPCVAEVVQ